MSLEQDQVFIIAEAGVNHNGELALAKKLVEVAAEAGADAVKFQTFKAENLATAWAPKAAYQEKNTGPEDSQLAMLKKLELSEASFIELKEHCTRHNIIFMSTPFDFASVDFLLNLGMDIFKIPSGEITNLPFLRKLGGLQEKVILSTGMSDLNEIKEAVEALLAAGLPKEKLTLLHCNTEYPTPFEDVNLRAMETLRTTFGVQVGYSDHTSSIVVPIAAVALGAKVIEKHFTLNKKMKGPDHQASLIPEELAVMVNSIRNTEKALGNGTKQCSPSEGKNRIVSRKSVVAACAISKGEIFTEKNLTVKRPGTGITPMQWDELLGKIATRNYSPDEPIS